MNPISVGACALLLSLAGATAVARLWPAPAAPRTTGRRRLGRSPMRSREVLETGVAYCPLENRDRRHHFLRLGGRLCECGHLTRENAR
ncbi:hypothetical protein [Streptomyces sp. NPDC127038]|uniref:hypothetical protein n=1 Tax=Streptomyces sp. NPDC127038 TaxID=3347114 RepID=UPI0036562A1C